MTSPIGYAKPDAGVEVDWSHPLADNLSYCWLFNEAPSRRSRNIGAVNGNDCTNIGASGYSFTWTSTRDGIGILQNSNSSVCSAGVLPTLSGASKVTLFVAGRMTISGSNLQVGCIINNNNRFALSHYYVDNNWYLICDSGSSTANATFTDSTTRSTACMTFDGSIGTAANRCSLWLDGIRRTLSGTPSYPTVTFTSGQTWNFSYSSLGGTSVLTAVYVWINRALTDSDIKDLHTNPWCFLDTCPSHTTWILGGTPVSVGSGSIAMSGLSQSDTGTFTAPGSGSPTLTGLSEADTGLFTSPGSGSITLDVFVTTATTAPLSIGSGSIVLALLSESDAAEFTASGSGSLLLAGLAESDSGSFTTDGSGSPILTDLSTLGTSGNIHIASGSITLSTLSDLGDADFKASGLGVPVLSGLSTAGSSSSLFSGSGSRSLASWSVSTVAKFTAPGSGSVSLVGLSVTASTVPTFVGVGSIVLSGLDLVNHGTWSFVQRSGGQNNTSGGQSVSATFTGAVTPGNVIVVALAGIAPNRIVVFDNKNETSYTSAGGANFGGRLVELFWFTAPIGGDGFTVTAKSVDSIHWLTGGTVSAPQFSMAIYEFGNTLPSMIEVALMEWGSSGQDASPASQQSQTATIESGLQPRHNVMGFQAALTTATSVILANGLTLGEVASPVSEMACGIGTGYKLNLSDYIDPSLSLSGLDYWTSVAVLFDARLENIGTCTFPSSGSGAINLASLVTIGHAS